MFYRQLHCSANPTEQWLVNRLEVQPFMVGV